MGKWFKRSLQVSIYKRNRDRNEYETTDALLFLAFWEVYRKIIIHKVDTLSVLDDR